MFRPLTALILIVTGAVSCPAMERISFQRGETKRHVSGKVLVEARDGGVLLLATDGRLWIVQPDELTARKKDNIPFAYDDADCLSKRLLDEMGEGFRIYKTAHYVICYNTTRAYAQWCGGLYERLYRGFFQYWQTRGIPLKEPQAPLTALVFNDQTSYSRYAKKELGTSTNSIIGYYNMRTNRVNMYDLTGVEGQVSAGRLQTAAHVNRILSQPAAERTVATIVHEATHQLSYNSGLQTRYADNPFWVSEGLAVYFETPDLNSSRGWRGIGGVNRFNLFQFRRRLKDRPQDSLTTLIRTDKRFRDTELGPAAYAEAWALNYYLLRTRPKQYTGYLKMLAEQPPLGEAEADRRLDDFRRYFGEDLEKFDRDFLRYMRRVR